MLELKNPKRETTQTHQPFRLQMEVPLPSDSNRIHKRNSVASRLIDEFTVGPVMPQLGPNRALHDMTSGRGRGRE